MADVDACTDHVNPGRIRLWVATHLLGLVQRVLWGFRIVVVPPCVAREYSAQRGYGASAVDGFDPAGMATSPPPKVATPEQIASAAKIGQYL